MRGSTRGGLLLLLVALLPVAAVAQARTPGPGALRQLEALIAEKSQRTPVQRKLGSSLLYAARVRRGQPVAPAAPELQLRSSVEVDAAGLTEVDIRADVTPALLADIADLGGSVVAAVPRYRAVRARVPLLRLEELAARPEVVAVREADRAHLNVVSEGDVAHRADVVRAAFGVDGSGVKVGVLSDGVGGLAARQDAGELPTVTVLPGQAGSGSEGTAMLEIVHDLAPGAELFFATAFTSQASFAQNILDLRTAGADVIVDDVSYFAEAVFQDDDVAKSVNNVTANGAWYFSSAGNSGNLDDGTSGVWEGDWAQSSFTRNGHPAQDFGGDDAGNRITLTSPFGYTLHWSDPIGGSGNDYDLYLMNSNMTAVIAASTSNQNGNDDPYEGVSAGANDVDRNLVIVKFSGAPRYLHLNANRGRLEHGTAGQTSGHGAAVEAFSVAAVDVADAGPGGVFDGSEPVETFSSDGPRRIFYEPDGTPVTPGDFLSTGGVDREKPDIAAADGVSTTTPGFSPFYGTSAAAPHAAAIAALVLEADSGADVRNAFETTALDIEAPGFDRDSGAGIVDAQAAVASVLGDGDGDAWPDDLDNCSVKPNPPQIDADQDGFGNACDADYNDDGVTGGSDLYTLRLAFGTSLGEPGYNPAVDLDGDDTVGNAELNFFKYQYGKPPGPSGLSCAGTIPCP